MKAYGRRRGTGPFTPSLCTRSRCVTNFTNPAVLPPEKELLIPTERETWWFSELVLNLRESEKKTLFFVLGIEPRIVQPVITEVKNETKFT